MAKRFRAAVIGLGRVGSRFDEESGRKTTWSHVGAYLAHTGAFELVAACESDPTNAAAFRKRSPGVRVHDDLATMLAEARPEVVSICTPALSHPEVLLAVVDQTPDLKVVWCEKPLATTLAEGEAMVEACRRRNVHLVVSHVRRWTPLWRQFKALIDGGAVGTLRCLRLAMPNRLWSMESHAVDLALYLGGEVTELRVLPIPDLEQEGEPARVALLGLASGAYAIVQVCGRKARLIVEAEAIGDGGRLFVREDRGTITTERFGTHPSYAGYLQLGEAQIETVAAPETFSPFVAIAEEIAALAADSTARPTCDGAEALKVQRILEQMAE